VKGFFYAFAVVMYVSAPGRIAGERWGSTREECSIVLSFGRPWELLPIQTTTKHDAFTNVPKYSYVTCHLFLIKTRSVLSSYSV
jgi:hypothetical protein